MALVPDERSLVEEFKGRPFAVVGVNLDDSREWRSAVKDAEIPWRNWNDDEHTISRQWRAALLPTIYLIDHKGTIQYEHIDLNKPWKLEREIKKLLKAAEAEQDGAG